MNVTDRYVPDAEVPFSYIFVKGCGLVTAKDIL